MKRKTSYKRELSLLHGKLQQQQSILYKNKLSLLERRLQRQKSIWHKNKLSLLKRKLERQHSIWHKNKSFAWKATVQLPTNEFLSKAKSQLPSENSYVLLSAKKIVYNYAYNLPPMFTTFTFLLVVVVLYSVLLANPSFISCLCSSLFFTLSRLCKRKVTTTLV